MIIKALPKTPEEIQAEYTQAIQVHLDAKAVEKGYDNIVSACSYAGYPNPFQAEGVVYGTWRANVWTKGYEILAQVQAGERPLPTIEELLAELPELVL